jgi:hypothetical protein
MANSNVFNNPVTLLSVNQMSSRDVFCVSFVRSCIPVKVRIQNFGHRTILRKLTTRCQKSEVVFVLVIGTGLPRYWVTDPYPYPPKPVPALTGTGRLTVGGCSATRATR